MHTSFDGDRIDSLDALRQLYDMPAERVTRLKFPRLDGHMARFVAVSPLVFIATGTVDGFDNSPRGGEPGFVHVLDSGHLAIPDWPGNNKLESITNILSGDGRCGLVFLVPHMDVFLRVNGTATLSRRPDLLQGFAAPGRPPKLVILVAVQEAYFHCGKALRRSSLWQPEGWQSPPLPSVGTIIREQSDMVDVTAEAIDADYQRALQDDLY